MTDSRVVATKTEPVEQETVSISSCLSPADSSFNSASIHDDEITDDEKPPELQLLPEEAEKKSSERMLKAVKKRKIKEEHIPIMAKVIST